MRATLIAMALLLGAQIVRAEPMEVISPQADAVSITIYRDLFALITETRTVDLPEGPVTLSFDGVVETLLPASAVVTDIGRTLKEQNFGYDPLSPNNLMTKSIGKSVTITRTLPGSARVVQMRAVVLAANDQGVTLRTESGNEALHCSGIPERLTFDEIPGDLRASPRLSIHLPPGKAGKRTVRLSYLAHGFAWKSDYVARLDPAGNRMDLTGWITLHNYTQASFRGAQVQVVAGKLHLIGAEDGGSSLTGDSDNFSDERDLSEAREEARDGLLQELEPKDDGLQLFSGCYALPGPSAQDGRHLEGAESMEEVIVTGLRGSFRASMDMKREAMIAVREELGDYQLYRLPVATDLNARQTKQAVFLAKPRVKVEHYYSFAFNGGGSDDEESLTPESMIAFENRKSSGLGEPLPQGMMRVFESTDTGELFVGEATMDDQPVNLPVELGVAKALDLGLEVDSREATADDLRNSGLDERTDVEVRAFNAKSVPVTLEILQYGGDSPNARIQRSSQRVRRKYGDFVWRLRVPANGNKTLTYRFEQPEETEPAE
jgi:hypothetical protein